MSPLLRFCNQPLSALGGLAWRGAQRLAMNVIEAGALNLAGFVRSTAGRIGLVNEIRGGVVVAGPVAIPHAYVNTAVPTDPRVSAADFFDDAISFFTGLDEGSFCGLL
jgi:hypothetical protein